MPEQKSGTKMNISSTSGTSFFDSAIDYLDYFNGMISLDFHIRHLKLGIHLLETFDLYVRKCKRKKSNQGDAASDSLRLSSILFQIQDLVQEIVYGLDFAHFREKSYFSDSDLSNKYFFDIIGEIPREIKRLEENMKLFFETDISELGIINSLPYYALGDLQLFFETDISELGIINSLPYYSLGDLQLVMDFTDSVSKNLARLRRYASDEALFAVMDILQEKLMFLRSFLRFAAIQGVEGQPLIDLLVHVEVVAFNAAGQASRFWCDRNTEEMKYGTGLEFPQEVIRKMIDPIDPQVREIYTHVLEASKLTRSSYTLAIKENRHLVSKFIDYLLQNIRRILSECYTTFLVKVKDQMLKLLEGVRFLRILLSLEQEKFDELNDAMKDLIGVMVSDAGIVTFSFFANEVKECLCRDTNPVLSDLLQVLEFIMAETAQVCPLTSSLSFSFPRTNELGSLDFLLETLKELLSSTADQIAYQNNQIRTILEDLVSLRSFLGNIVEQRNKDGKLQALWSRVMKAAYSVEIEIDCALLGDTHKLCLDGVAEDIRLMKTEAEKIFDSIRYDGKTQGVTNTIMKMPSQVTAPISNEALVGLNDEIESIFGRLVRGSSQLDIVAIVGMPGLGKTTIASKVYSDPLVKFHFHKLAWCNVSQAYNKCSLLDQILCCIDSERSAQMNEDDMAHKHYKLLKEDDMAHKLYKLLKGHRYLIVLDDVWDIGGWELLQHSLPNDCNGSRILLTSRFHQLSLQIKPNSKPHHLRPLTGNESCELLQNKLFVRENCPPTLGKVFLRIANYCKGLPLAIVLVAGILSGVEQACWKKLVRHLTSSIYGDNEHCMKTLEQSYYHLPDWLKPCLLYFSAFKEDQEIPVQKMLRLWISEGFVQKTEGKSLEDVADDYLMDLIGRSLVMVTQQRSLGGVKACRIHDLVHEFCVAKSKEESFIYSLHKDEHLNFIGPSYTHRLSIHPTTTMVLTKSMLFFPNLRCLHLFGLIVWLDKIPFNYPLPKSLRVLNLACTFVTVGTSMTTMVPRRVLREVTFLVHLRYLRITYRFENIPSTIANLSRLETFVVEDGCYLPNTIWNIKTLRHLVTEGPKVIGFGFIFPIDNLESSPDLKHLDTLALAINPNSQHFQKMLSKLPSICRLTITPTKDLGSKFAGNHDGILVLNHLSRLESLKICQFNAFEFEFPLNLKKLTLIGQRQPWSKISAIGKLPNLEVLKLYNDNSLGERWEMEEGEFPSLRFLKLSSLDICCWIAYSNNFSCLERLVLEKCRRLEEVPSCLGESLTLEMIEVKWCSECVVSFVEQIHREQKDLGNEGLKIVIAKENDV